MDNITYAGHSAVLLHIGQSTIGIDPWLQGNPRCPESLLNPKKLDLIILSHGHSDHASDTLRLAHQYQCPVVASFELVQLLQAEGLPANQAIGMNPGGCINFADFKVCLTKSFHSSSYESSLRGTQYAGEACGAIVRSSDFCLYHAGDTSLFSDLKLIGEVYRPDVACLPIGDVYTMGAYDAAVAASWLKCDFAVPLHYATFPTLTGTTEQFSEACRQMGVRDLILEPGENYAFS